MTSNTPNFLGRFLREPLIWGAILGGYPREHPGEHLTPTSLLASVSPPQGAMGPLGLGPTPQRVGCPRQLEMGCPRQLEMGCPRQLEMVPRGRLCRGRPPHAPPPNLRGFILVSFTSKFTDILG